MAFVHNIDPILFSLGPVAIRYYSLAYIIGILATFAWLTWLSKTKRIALTEKEIDSLLTCLVIGVVAGGRLGYMLFYDPTHLFTLQTFKIWEGGMSFHGGLLGTMIAVLIFAKQYKKKFFEISDLLIAPACLGLFLGRIANFINGELVGTQTTASWCVVFPKYDQACRHPSQLYEAAKNIVMLAVILPFTFYKQLQTGIITALFFIMYGTLRFTITFFREDARYLGLSQGQYLSLATAILGIAMLVYLKKQKDKPSERQYTTNKKTQKS